MHLLHAHLVFTPKDRRGVFTEAMLIRCEQVMRSVCADFGVELAQFNSEADHVHLLVRYPPKVAVSALVNSLNGVSARRLRAEFTRAVNRVLWGGHFCRHRIFAASAGGAPR